MPGATAVLETPALLETPVALVALRPAGPDDRAGLRDLLRRISPATAFSRFFTGLGEPSEAMMTLLMRDEPGAGTWVAASACAADDGSGETRPPAAPRIVGHASWTVDPTGVAEISVLVDDAWHSLGIGHDLVGRVLDAAREHGASSLRIDVLASNRRVVNMIARRWPAARVERDGTELTYAVPLA